MKTPSEDLFKLIKSLSTIEKGLFKDFFNNEINTSSYLILFDIIDTLNFYDESLVKEKLLKKGVKEGIKDLKKYLKESIFRFLEYYSYDASIEIELQRALQRIEILYDRRLYEMSNQQISKAEKTATLHHQYLYLLDILKWKRKIAIQQENLNAIYGYEKEDYIDELKSLELYKNIIEYRKIHLQVSGYKISEGANLNNSTKKTFHLLLNNNYLKDEKLALSVPAKIIRFNILIDVNIILKKWDHCYLYCKKQIENFSQYKFTTVEKMVAYSKFSIPLSELKKDEELMMIKVAVDNLVLGLQKKNQTPRLMSFYVNYIGNYMDYQRSVLNIDEALKTREEIHEKTLKYAPKQIVLVFYFNSFLCYFLKQDYRKSLLFCNKILVDEKLGVRKDLVGIVKILNIIVHYELGNDDKVRSLCNSYLRNFKTNKLEIEIEIVAFLNQLASKRVSKQNMIIVFRFFREKLISYRKEQILLEFDVISWIESKIQNRPMIEVLKEKVKG